MRPGHKLVLVGLRRGEGNRRAGVEVLPALNCTAISIGQVGVKRKGAVMKTSRIMLLAGVFAAAQPIGPTAAMTVSGQVTDTADSPVAGARIAFANEAIPSQLFSDSTDTDGTFRVSLGAVTAVEQGPMSSLPTAFHLFQNYPNPFNPSTLLPYQVGTTAHVRLRIYNLLGQPIRTLVDQVQPAGLQVMEWDGRGDSGVGVGAGV
jgi:type 1 fimbria pilin